MRIGGFLKFSLIDYPGKLACVIFTQGCNFHCHFCYNPELVYPTMFGERIPEEEVLEFLKARKGYLEGVVLTGGEPTIQNDLISFLDQIKQLGYLIKLDTNGSDPKVLQTVITLKLVNYVAMDVKSTLNKYEEVVGAKVNHDRIKESIDILLNSGIKYQFRTTLVKPLCSAEDLPAIAASIRGAKRYTLQRFMPSKKILDKSLEEQRNYTEQEITKYQGMMTNLYL